ncbi:MAG: helix-turn-helix domain-containing protein [Alphaproteobacteria bacterium]|nr:helix-turn-helix domain-containing protein [Alphaproteobacteria bacterium]
MEQSVLPDETAIDRRIAERLKAMRADRGWSLDELAKRSGASRASLSRLENAETSPTASLLGRLAAAYGMTISRLLHRVEDEYAPLVRRADQPVFVDPDTGFRRRTVSPPSAGLDGEVLEGELKPGTSIAYDASPREGLEHHLVMLEGELDITLSGATHSLKAGDCIRYRLAGASAFRTRRRAARYLIFIA